MTARPSSTSKSNSPATLGTDSISRLLMQYSVPAIIASVATSLYNIIDSIFIGQGVNAMAISGLAITFPLMNLVIAFVMLIAAGGATISSIFLGQKDLGRATNVVNNVMMLSLIHSVIFGGLSLVFLDEILDLFGATPETIGYAREFMTVILYGTPISFVFIGLNNLMRATGYPKKAMISALLSVLVNLILCPLFIFKFKWGDSRCCHRHSLRTKRCIRMGARAFFIEKKLRAFPPVEQLVVAGDSQTDLCHRPVTVSDEPVCMRSGGVHQQVTALLRRSGR